MVKNGWQIGWSFCLASFDKSSCNRVEKLEARAIERMRHELGIHLSGCRCSSTTLGIKSYGGTVNRASPSSNTTTATTTWCWWPAVKVTPGYLQQVSFCSRAWCGTKRNCLFVSARQNRPRWTPFIVDSSPLTPWPRDVHNKRSSQHVSSSFPPLIVDTNTAC